MRSLISNKKNLTNYLTEVGDYSLETKAARIAADCSKAELRAPCSAGRKWKCVLVNGRWRRHKCRYEVNIVLKFCR